MSIVYLPIASAFGQNVKPFDGALLYFYEVGTTTLKTVYTDKAETIAATNPVVADANGRFAAMYISGLYKAVLKDKNGVEIWSEDNLQGRTGDVIWQGNFDSTTNSSNYPASGNQGDTYVVTTGFTLATASGSHVLQTRDFIICNKDGATAIDADWDIQRGSRVFQKEVYTASKNLILSNITNTTIDLDADILHVLSVTNSSNEIKQLSDVDLQFDSATDTVGGNAIKPSTWYDIWLDFDLNKKLAPRITGTADGTTAGFLEDSTNTFATDLVKAGDIVRNKSTYTQTTVLTTPTVDGADLAVVDDIFLNTNSYEIIMQTLTGIGAFKANPGKVYSSSGSVFTDSKKNGRARITTSFWHTVNGYGSSSTKIQKFTTEVDESDNVVVTVVNSATLGFTITANMSCELYVITVPCFNAGGRGGLSINSSELTTNINTITVADRLVSGNTIGNNNTTVISWSGEVKKGDVIRPHTAGTADGSQPDLGSIHVLAVEII